MKFSHGVWRLRDGVQPFWAARVIEHYEQDGALVIHCIDRTDPKLLLNAYATVIRVSSPLPDVIRVQVRHWLGTTPRPPDFPLELGGAAPAALVEETPEEIRFTAGRVGLRIGKSPFTLEFVGPDGATRKTPERSLGVMKVAGERDYLMQRLPLDLGECVYGLGERFGPLVKNGQAVTIWNEDPGTATEQAYKNVPFYLTNRGFGVFVNNPGKVDFEIATERVNAVQISVSDNELDYFVIFGDGPKQVLSSYGALTGRPALPPIWSFGLWLSTSFLTDYDEKIVGAMIDGMFERRIPLSVFHFDCLWMREHHWCDFTWDARKFPDPKAMLTRLKQRGIKVCVWINPYISELSSLFAEGRERGYFLKTRSGDVYQRYDWQPGIALVDFTNPEAVSWYQAKLRALLDLGVDCFKTDFGERIPPDAVYSDGSSAERMHNFYPYLYNQAVFSLLEAHFGRGQAVVFARSATAGAQRFPVHWGGDSDATFDSMAETLRGGLCFGLSAGAFWSHDISGFNATATPALYKRWVAFGLLSSHSRLHGGTSYRVPWEFDEESVDVLRVFTELKHRLMPYVWQAALEAREAGLPLLRAMVLEFPDDPNCDHLDQQYLFGERLLVAPVMNEAGRVRYYVPEGVWTDWFSGARVVGPRWVDERAVPFDRIPLLVRPGTLLATGTRSDRPDYDFTAHLALELFELADGAEARAQVDAPDGSRRLSFRAERRGQRVTVTAGGELTALPPSVLLRGAARPQSVSQGSVVAELPEGVRVAWESLTAPLVIELSAPATSLRSPLGSGASSSSAGAGRLSSRLLLQRAPRRTSGWAARGGVRRK